MVHLAVLNTIAKLPYEYAEDGISYTFAITPAALGKEEKQNYKLSKYVRWIF